MIDSKLIPLFLHDLETTVRSIERETKQTAQLTVKVGEDFYLVGDLTARKGEYRIEMDSGSHQNLSGSYKSFHELLDVVEPRRRGPSRNHPPNLIEIPGKGFFVGYINYPGRYAKREHTYEVIGKIIFPLLQESEEVTIKKL